VFASLQVTTPATAGPPIHTLELVDPRSYHLCTVLTLLADHAMAWLPAALPAGGNVESCAEAARGAVRS
jgi:hypothetical protein